MVQFSPDTDRDLWETAGGYEYSDKTIMGFSTTHLSGTGIPDLGDFLFMPQCGEPKYIAGAKDKPEEGYRSAYDHDQESAAAGYYKVKLLKHNITTELTAGDRAGIMRFTFPENKQSSILTDLQHFLSGQKFKITWSHVRMEDSSTVTGYHLVNGWGKERHLYYAARYSRPFDSFNIIRNGEISKYDSFKNYRFNSANEAAGTNLQFIANYATKADEQISVKIAVSAISAANALENLDSEIPAWDFEAVRKATADKWNKELSRIQIEGTDAEKETFYTAMYHCFQAPNLYQDKNGQYRGLDANIHQSKPNEQNYAVFSLWDTYRATHPLFTLIQEERDAGMINSMLDHYDQSADHLLPVWSLQANETWCMIGYHAVPVIVDAYMKGVKGFDYTRAYEAVRTTALNPHYDAVATYDKLGWVPFDQENESVSKTLEYAYDDYCVAQMAKGMGKTEDYDHFMKRAGSYKNIFDKETGLMRGKDSKGQWRIPFDPRLFTQGGDITEGTSWQYTWYVPQDVPGLISLMGGNEKFTTKLDELFTLKDNESQGLDDVQGRIGEYWHGNEPAHHVVYLYCYAGQPWKAQEKLRYILKSQYGNKPNSLTGNDDCGQMSAWYIFTALGFYPVCPGSNEYVIGSPSVKKATMNLSNGKSLTVEAEDQSDSNIYVQSVTINGKPWNSVFLPQKTIATGGTILFKMGSKPNKTWGIQ